jgi:hypothetical protein
LYEIFSYWKIVFLEKLFKLRNYLHWKSIFIKKNFLHWKTTFIKKIVCILKLLSLKILLALKNLLTWKKMLALKIFLHWKLFSLKNKSLHWKTTCIGKIACIEKKHFIENLLHIQNVTFKIIFGTWWKLMYENFPFPLEKTMKMII